LAWGADALVVEPPFVQRVGRRNGARGGRWQKYVGELWDR
jgi:hypothetical protein